MLPGRDWPLILLAAAGLLLIYGLNTGLMAIVTYWGHMLCINIETEMRRKSFDHLQRLSFGFYDDHEAGHLVARITKDLEEIGEIAHHGPEDLRIAVMTFLGAFELMLQVNARLALITALVVPLTAWITSRYGGRITRNWHDLFGRVGAFNARIEENVGGIRVVQAFANEDHERRLFALANARYRAIKLDAYRVMAASTSLSYFSMRVTQLVVMVAGTWFVLHGELSNGQFVEKPPILILDEATSALDIETEQEIKKSLAELSDGRTTLLIAHRLATIAGADRIFIVDHGGIRERTRDDVAIGDRVS